MLGLGDDQHFLREGGREGVKYTWYIKATKRTNAKFSHQVHIQRLSKLPDDLRIAATHEVLTVLSQILGYSTDLGQLAAGGD